jgi:hypothetical protein
MPRVPDDQRKRAPGGGRKRLDPDSETTQITIRVSADDLATFEAAALAAGFKRPTKKGEEPRGAPGAWLRSLGRKATGMDPSE